MTKEQRLFASRAPTLCVWTQRGRSPVCEQQHVEGDRMGCSSALCSSDWIVMECCQHTWEGKMCAILQMDMLLWALRVFSYPLVASANLRAQYGCQCAVEWSMPWLVLACLWPQKICVYLSPFFRLLCAVSVQLINCVKGKLTLSWWVLWPRVKTAMKSAWETE